jgi:asparagine synthase (glutamine-hydrolysing)
MCGIAGYFLKTNTEKKSETILKMLEFQKSRGPDDSGILGINVKENILEELSIEKSCVFSNNPSLIFGFNRLSILDLSPAGHQPMINKEAQVALMMNGEVYNAFDFKPELIAKGYIFQGNSDTEVVLHLYLEYGLNGMLERLNGMFALAIYDGRVQNLYLVRDRVGIKPLYVLQEENYIAFASEMKSFKALPNFKFKLDESKLSEFLFFRNVINHTLFQSIVNISPGTYWTINANCSFSETTYYDIRNAGNNPKTISQKELEVALRNAVKRQMISDVKLGSQLSGGVDSSLVTAFATETSPSGSLETVSIVFDEKRFSEKKYIDKVACKYKLQSHQFKLNENVYLDLIDKAIWHFEQPLNHPNTIGIMLLSREAKKHVTVLLSGEGADESLAGYSRFVASKTKLLSLATLKRAFKNKSQFLTFSMVWVNQDNRYLLQTAYGNIAESMALYPNFSVHDALASRKKIWNSIHDNKPRKKRKYELLTYLPDLLMRQDKMSMSYSIENRVPFLDNEMLETALQVSDDMLIRKRKGRWEGKFLLKEICSEKFDENFAYRNKMSFGIPLISFFSSEPFQKRWQRDLLPGIQRRGLFNTKPLVQWMVNPKKMTIEQLDSLWLMIGFEIWAKQYLD